MSPKIADFWKCLILYRCDSLTLFHYYRAIRWLHKFTYPQKRGKHQKDDCHPFQNFRSFGGIWNPTPVQNHHAFLYPIIHLAAPFASEPLPL